MRAVKVGVSVGRDSSNSLFEGQHWREDKQELLNKQPEKVTAFRIRFIPKKQLQSHKSQNHNRSGFCDNKNNLYITVYT